MLKARLLSGTSLLIAGVLLLVINVLAMTLLPAARFDLTQSRLYTLSDLTAVHLAQRMGRQTPWRAHRATQIGQ